MARTPAFLISKRWLEIAYAPTDWDVGNDWLYKLCKRYPKHKNVQEVVAKIWLIGRAYSAAAERGVSGKGQSEDYIIRLSQRFIDQNADRFLARLPKQPGNFNEHLSVVTETHHLVESVFSNDDELGRVSLTSKYLHFHRPDLFPIYDSRAATAIAKVTPDSRFTGYALPPEHATTLYGKFCVRCAWLIDEMTRQANKTPTLRQLDTMLLQIYREVSRNE